MKNYNLTYRKSGVNINAADSFIKYISKKVRKAKKSGKFKNIGGFGSLSEVPKNLKSPHVVASSDGVGTKVEIANELKKFDTIGIDLVAMSVNDLIIQGAKPKLFLDYISIPKIDLKKLKSIISGIIKGCNIADCELVGGETAEMPGVYSKDKFDLAGFAIGFVDKKNILKKENVKENNLILAVPSSGLHSNGFSLVREVIKKNSIKINKDKFLKKELLRPTKIYVKEVCNLIEKRLLNACANITGGGIEDNLKRVIPKGYTANINLNEIKTLKIFEWLKKNGVSDKEMLKTFNCGVGFCLIIEKKNLLKVLKVFKKPYKPYIIGKIKKGSKLIQIDEKIKW